MRKHGTHVCMRLLIEDGHYFAYKIDIGGYYSRKATNRGRHLIKEIRCIVLGTVLVVIDLHVYMYMYVYIQ